MELRHIEGILKYFNELNAIPRPSGHEEQVVEYLKKYAEEHKLYFKKDEFNNVVIRKKGTDGYEDSKMVTLQGHSDMVAEKRKDSSHDFLKDPIKMYTEGDLLKAKETTLGADNGIAIAMALYLMSLEDVSHPPIELLVTSDEETEMTGALNLKEDFLEGHYLLNLDSEEEGYLTMGSAGGELLTVSLKTEKENYAGNSYNINFFGLLGGHSGMMIGSKKGNIIKVMARFLEELGKLMDFRISKIDSGTKDNSIPREGFVNIVTENFKKDDFKKVQELILKEFNDLEGELSIEYEETEDKFIPYKKEFSNNIVKLLKEIQTGVIAREKADSSLVETSLNLAIVREMEDKLVIQVSTRSSVEDKILKLRNDLKEISHKYGAELKDSGLYPGWEYKDTSRLREITLKTYKELTGREMTSIIVHAGLECGAILKKFPHMDAISIGPNIKDAHTPDENLSISSTGRVFEHLLLILKELK